MPLAKATRSSMNVLKLWTTDRGTFPVVLIAGVAASAAAFSATRYLFQHPDVRFDKDRRLSSLHHKADEGAEWRARRFRFANYARNPINQSHQYDTLFEKHENQVAVVASSIASSEAHTVASVSSPLEIHRRRECTMERLWETAFAHSNTTTEKLFNLPQSDAAVVAVWTRGDSCGHRNATASPSSDCLVPSNVAIADGALALQASSSGSSGVSVSVAFGQTSASDSAHRLRLHAFFPASGPAFNATASLSLSPAVSASLTLVSHANASRVLRLEVCSPSRNASVELTPPCPLDPAAAKSHVVDIEWETASASVQWIRWHWDGHALYEVGVALSATAATSPTTTAPLNVSLSLSSPTNNSAQPSSLRVKKLEIQRVAGGQDASVCRPRVIHADANCRPNHQHFEPRLGDDQGYLSLAQVDDFVRAVPSRFPPQLTKVEEIGVSTENRSLLALCVGACAETGNSSELTPQVLFTGMHHSREPISMMNLVYTIDLLALDFANGDLDVATLLLTHQLWFVLVVNPDGYARNEALETWANRRAGQRKNARTKGGCTTSKADIGVDLNRNYDVCFSEDDVGSSTDPCGEDYRGPAPFSEPETLAIKRFVERAGSHFTVSLNYHSFGRYFNVPFACKDMDTPKGKDLEVYENWAKEMTRFNGFRYGQPWKDDNLYSVNGETSDWLWAKHGIFAMSPEVGPAFSTPIDEGFWPAKEDVPALSVELHYSNLVAAKLAGPIYQVVVANVTREPAADDDEGLSALLHVKLELQNHGLRTGGDVEIVLTTALDDSGLTDKFTTTASVKADALGTIRSNSTKPLTASRSLAIPESDVLHLLVRDALSCQYIRLTTFASANDATSVAYQQWQPVEMPLCGVCRLLGRDDEELKSLDAAPRACQSVEDLVQADALAVAVLRSEVVDQADNADDADASDEERDAKSESPATPPASTPAATAAPTTATPSTPAVTTATPKPSPSTMSPPPATTAPTPSPTSTAPPPSPSTAEPVDSQLSVAKTSSSSFASITSFVSVPILASVFLVLLIVVAVVLRRRRRQSREPVKTNASGSSKAKAVSKRKNYVQVVNEDEEDDDDGSDSHATARSPRSRGLRGGGSDDEEAEYGRRRGAASPSTTSSKRHAASDDDELV